MLDRAQVCKLKAPILAAMLYKARDLTLGIAIVKAGKVNSGLENFVLQTIPPALCPWHYFSGAYPAGELKRNPAQGPLHPAEPLTTAINLPRLVYALTFDLL